MKYLIIVMLVTFSPISHGQEPERKRGEVVSVVEWKSYMPRTNKTIVLVWDGSKSVKVELLTSYLGKVEIGKVFPYSIRKDRKGKYVSSGRKGL